MACNLLIQKALPCKPFSVNAEEIHHRGGNIGEGPSGAEILPCLALAVHEHGGVLAGVVGGGGGGVTAVVGGDDEEVILTQGGDEVGEPAVELGQRGGVALHVVAVAVDHVEVHEVGKADAVEIPLGHLGGGGHALGIAPRADGLGDALAYEDIGDLAHGDRVQTRFLDGIQHGGGGRQDGVVVAAGGALEGGCALKGAGDDAAHGVLAVPFVGQHIPRDLADAVQLLDGHLVLVCGDLEDAVGGGVDNQLARGQMLLAVVADDVGARVGLVAEYPVARAAGELGKYLGGKALGIGGQGIGGDDAGYLPVSDGGVLTARGLGHAGVGAHGSGLAHKVGGVGHTVDVEKAQLLHGGASKGGVVADGSEGVASLVVPFVCVGHFPDAEAVEDDEKYAVVHSDFLSAVGEFTIRGRGGRHPRSSLRSRR